MKEELCKAFCDELTFRDVPAGVAVSTAFDGLGGEPIGFYIVGPNRAGRYRIEDDGTTVPLLEALGADRDNKTRAEAFERMLEEYGVTYSEDACELVSKQVTAEELPHAAMRFVALLLRLQDLELLTPERVASTFREDASRAITDAFKDMPVVQVKEDATVSGIEYPADFLIQAPEREPVAIFLAATEQRLLEAVIVQMAALYEAHVPCAVVALLDKDTSVTKKSQTKASNRLSAVTFFEGDESAAITRIRREVLGPQFTTVH